VLFNSVTAYTLRQPLQTEVNLSASRPYIESTEKPIPPKMYAANINHDGYSDLIPDDYVRIIIGDQINYYKKIVQLDLRLKVFQWLIYITRGIGLLLAAIGFKLWVAPTIALVALFTTFLEHRQIQNTLSNTTKQ
jgi:SMODS and SLOG-associating 2TM effector domain 1